MGIAEKIKFIRDHYHLKQSDLGKIAGVSDKAVWTWENGTAEPRMGAIQKIADHFGIPKSAIVDDESTNLTVDALEKEMKLYYLALNIEGREKLCDYARDLYLSGAYKKHDSHDMVGEA